MSRDDLTRRIEEAVLAFIREQGGTAFELEVVFGVAPSFDDGGILVVLRDLVARGELVRMGRGRRSWYSIAPASPSPAPSDRPLRPRSLLRDAAHVEPEQNAALARPVTSRR